MITWFARHTSQLLISLAFLFTLAACGGGGGGSGGGGGFLPDNGSGSDGRVYKLDLEMYDSLGNPTSTVSSTTPATLIATVYVGKNPIKGIVVTLSTDVGSIAPASGTALSNENGEASFTIEQGGTLGAGTLTATISPEDGASVSENFTFEVAMASLRIGYFDGDVFIEGEIGTLIDSLPSGGTTVLRMAVVDDEGEEVSTEEEIKLRSDCSVNGLATLPATVTTIDGRASADYTAAGCLESDTVTATLVNGGALATVTLRVASPTVNSINFKSATPTSLALKGTGGTDRQETSEVVFEVVSGTGAPIAGEIVQLSLSTEVGGLSLLNSSGVSDASGLVRASVLAGNVSTAVRVIATIEVQKNNGNTILLSTVSDVLVVSTGLPDQNSISLSVSVFNVAAAMNKDGVGNCITVRMADKFNNPVPNGTLAAFTTEYGSIDSSCVTGVSNGERAGSCDAFEKGSCSVQWVSQNPRGFEDIGSVAVGRSTIQVTAIGEEYFVDTNGNGTFDKNEIFNNLPEAFLDRNEDGKFTPASNPNDLTGAEETFTDFNQNSTYDLNNNPALYNGILCPEQGDGDWCSRDLLNVRASVVVVMSHEIMTTVLRNSAGAVVSGTTEGPSYYAYIVDSNGNPPSSTGSVSVSTTGDCSLLSPDSPEIPNTSASGPFIVEIRTEGDGGKQVPGEQDGKVLVSVTNGGAEVVTEFNCASTLPPAEPSDGGGDGGLTLGG